MDQWQDLTIAQVEELLNAMKHENRSAEIDWVNRTIRVLSDVKYGKKLMSDGKPMSWQDIIHQV